MVPGWSICRLPFRLPWLLDSPAPAQQRRRRNGRAHSHFTTAVARKAFLGSNLLEEVKIHEQQSVRNRKDPAGGIIGWMTDSQPI